MSSAAPGTYEVVKVVDDRLSSNHTKVLEARIGPNSETFMQITASNQLTTSPVFTIQLPSYATGLSRRVVWHMEGSLVIQGENLQLLGGPPGEDYPYFDTVGFAQFPIQRACSSMTVQVNDATLSIGNIGAILPALLRKGLTSKEIGGALSLTNAAPDFTSDYSFDAPNMYIDYTNQSYIQWGSTHSAKFSATDGVTKDGYSNYVADSRIKGILSYTYNATSATQLTIGFSIHEPLVIPPFEYSSESHSKSIFGCNTLQVNAQITAPHRMLSIALNSYPAMTASVNNVTTALSVALTAATTYSALYVTALTESIPASTTITLTLGSDTQNVTTTTLARVGDTQINILPVAAAYAFTTSTVVTAQITLGAEEQVTVSSVQLLPTAQYLSVNYVTASDSFYAVDRPYLYGFGSVQSWQSTISSGYYTLGQTIQGSSSTFDLPIIPKGFIVYCTYSEVDRLDATQSLPDVFFPCTAIQVSFMTRSGLLSSASKAELYNMNVRNGVNFPYWASGGLQLLGSYNTASAAGHSVPANNILAFRRLANPIGSGNILYIDVAGDLSLPEGLTPGMAIKTQFSVTSATFVNNMPNYNLNTPQTAPAISGGRNAPQIVVIAITDGLLTNYHGSSQVELGGIIGNTVVLDDTATQVMRTEMSRIQRDGGFGGSKFGSWLKDVGRSLAPTSRYDYSDAGYGGTLLGGGPHHKRRRNLRDMY